MIIDGETIDSCIYLAVWAEGKNIRTLEGLEKNRRTDRIQEAFIERGCNSVWILYTGFCYVCDSPSGTGKRTDQRGN